MFSMFFFYKPSEFSLVLDAIYTFDSTDQIIFTIDHKLCKVTMASEHQINLDLFYQYYRESTYDGI